MRVEIADPLIEQAVGLALAGGAPEKATYHRQREEIYAHDDAEARDDAFRAFHRRWFLDLGLQAPIEEALAEVPGVGAGADRCCVSAAARAAQEGAELYVSRTEGAEQRVVAVRLLPETLVTRSRLRWLLRRELLHVADMLDPAFGYEPRLPASSAGPVHDELVRARYGVLWSTTVLGRLARRGQAPEGTESAARERFLSAFAMLGTLAHDLFVWLFHAERPRHAELVALASEPLAALEMTPEEGRADRCPLCGFPSAVGPSSDLEREVVALLRREKPRWRPEQGLCPRCADLYRVRAGVFARLPELESDAT